MAPRVRRHNPRMRPAPGHRRHSPESVLAWALPDSVAPGGPPVPGAVPDMASMAGAVVVLLGEGGVDPPRPR